MLNEKGRGKQFNAFWTEHEEKEKTRHLKTGPILQWQREKTRGKRKGKPKRREETEKQVVESVSSPPGEDFIKALPQKDIKKKKKGRRKRKPWRCRGKSERLGKEKNRKNAVNEH